MWEEERAREEARGVLHSYEEMRKEQLELFPGRQERPTPPPPGDEARVWMLAGRADKPWEGPFTIAELLCRPRFSAIMRVRNTQEGVEARAREFPQIRLALHNLARKKPLGPGRREPLPALPHPAHRGVLRRAWASASAAAAGDGWSTRPPSTGSSPAGRSISPSRCARKPGGSARTVVRNPLKRQKIESALAADVPCPNCGYRMVARPYNYQYFVPVDKCLSCSKIWFDSDELEILQILIEDRAAK